jgi:hypothetical protein
MADRPEYYLTAWEGAWQLKKVGGVKVLKTFADKAQAMAFAQVMIAKQNASFRLQNPDGTWQTM